MSLIALVHQLSPKLPVSFGYIRQAQHMRNDPLQLPPSFSSENRLTELRAHMTKYRQRIRVPSSTSAVNHQADALRPVSAVADRPLQRPMVISPMRRRSSQSTHQLKL